VFVLASFKLSSACWQCKKWEKSNMKTGKNVDPLKKKIFERRLLGNLTTNS